MIDPFQTVRDPESFARNICDSVVAKHFGYTRWPNSLFFCAPKYVITDTLGFVGAAHENNTSTTLYLVKL